MDEKKFIIFNGNTYLYAIERLQIFNYYCQIKIIISCNTPSIHHPSSMLIDNYDPASVKLFSKCARNQASKNNKKKLSSSSPKPYLTVKYNQTQKKKKQVCGFDMTQSRQQRQKKYASTITPAVGQYNPKVENKIKLTWDILKIYHKKNQSRKNNVTINSIELEPEQKNQQVENNQTGIMMPTQISEQFYDKPTIKRKNMKNKNVINIQSQQKQQSIQNSQRDTGKISRYQTMKSQVDMSRMTGRSDNKRYATIHNESPSNSQIFDLNKSIKIIKNKAYRKIQFQKQITRDKLNSLDQKNVVASDYSFDYKIVRPKAPTLIDFGKRVGREEKKKIHNEYSYTHYDYNKYVWQQKSNIFTNTKTNITDFKKQINRVLFKR